MVLSDCGCGVYDRAHCHLPKDQWSILIAGSLLGHFCIPDHPDRVFDAASPPLQGGEFPNKKGPFFVKGPFYLGVSPEAQCSMMWFPKSSLSWFRYRLFS